jgi:hypothetical protein
LVFAKKFLSFFEKKNSKVMLALLQTLKPNMRETVQKKKKSIFKCVLDFSFAPIGVCNFSLKKVKFVVSYCTTHPYQKVDHEANVESHVHLKAKLNIK